MDKKEKTDKKRSWKKVVLTILCAILLLFLLVAIAVTVFLNHLLGSMNRVDPSKESTISASDADAFLNDDPELETIDPNTNETYINIEDITFPSEPTGPQPTPGATEPVQTQPKPTNPPLPDVYGSHLVNIMLIGQDRREGQGRQRSDTMILVSINKSDGTITLTSFMRDQYVQIPGYKPNKLNSAYAFGGMSLLSRTLELNFGVRVDGMVEVDFSGFEKVINLVGGVDIKLTEEEVAHFNRRGWNFVVGVNHLNGRAALNYARLRSIDTDYNRASRQRNVIIALIEAYKNQPLDQMLGMLDDILPMVTTNLSNGQIISYATDLFPMLANAKINTLRIPVDGTFKAGKVQVREGFTGWFQYNIDFYANKKVLWEVFRCKE